MALLKQIKFGTGAATPIAQTQVAISSDSNKVLSVVGTNTGVDVEADPLYTIALAVDGKTITKTGNDGLATSLRLAYHDAVTTEGSEKGAYIALEDNTGTSISNSEIPVASLIGNGVLKGASYDETTGILTLTFATASGADTTVDVNLGKLLDIDDIVIAQGSGDYLSFDLADPAAETGQAVLGVKLADVTFAAASGENPANLTVDTTNGKILDASDAIPAIKQYVDAQTTDLAVTAEGDAYVAASVDAATNNKHVIVDSNVVVLAATAGTAGEYGADGSETKAPVAGTLSGTANSLVDGADVAAKVKTYVDGEIAIEEARADAAVLAAVQALDATVGSTTVDTGKHVAVQVVEENGKLTSLTVTENDIASAAALSDEIARAKAAESEIADKVGLTGVEGSRTFTPTTNYGGAGTQSAATSVMDNMQKIDTALKAVSDKADAIQYKVSGTTLEFFGMTAHT